MSIKNTGPGLLLVYTAPCLAQWGCNLDWSLWALLFCAICSSHLLLVNLSPWQMESTECHPGGSIPQSWLMWVGRGAKEGVEKVGSDHTCTHSRLWSSIAYSGDPTCCIRPKIWFCANYRCQEIIYGVIPAKEQLAFIIPFGFQKLQSNIGTHHAELKIENVILWFNVGLNKLYSSKIVVILLRRK